VSAREHHSLVSITHLRPQPVGIQEGEGGILEANEALSSIVLRCCSKDQASAFQRLQMVGEQRHRDIQQGGQFLCAAITEGNVMQQGQPVPIRQHPMDSCALRPRLLHSVSIAGSAK
jgi:hypothetical protein